MRVGRPRTPRNGPGTVEAGLAFATGVFGFFAFGIAFGLPLVLAWRGRSRSEPGLVGVPTRRLARWAMVLAALQAALVFLVAFSFVFVGSTSRHSGGGCDGPCPAPVSSGRGELYGLFWGPVITVLLGLTVGACTLLAAVLAERRSGGAGRADVVHTVS